jgi:uroporphyrin-III C-methyltransferase
MDIFSDNGKAHTPVATVKDIVFKAQFESIANPAIIMVGEVVSLHPSFLRQHIRELGHTLSPVAEPHFKEK